VCDTGRGLGEGVVQTPRVASPKKKSGCLVGWFGGLGCRVLIEMRRDKV
jgi:hypothetical protein